MANEVEPTVLEKYELDKRLGKGAYGIVWRATEKETSKIVALKKIFDAFRNETDSQRTFREICYLKEFSDHESIIKLLNVIRSENKKDIYLIFEYMPADLESLISRPNVLKNIHKKSIIYQILKGLLYIHSSNVVHRDLKPSNVLIDGNCLVKICDFGMARSLHTNVNEVGDVAMTDYVATRWYRAPEILLSSPKYTTKIDMWSLGCIHGELYRGKPLFPGNSTLNQIDYILSVVPPKSREDINSINSTYASNLLFRRNKKYPQKPLNTLLTSTTPEDALSLLKELLTFNPNKRVSAHEALKHPYLGEFYQPNELKTLYYDVIPPIDEAQKLTISEYREMLFKDTLGDHLKCRRAKHSFIEYKPVKESTYQSAWRASFINEKSSGSEYEKEKDPQNTRVKAKESWKTLFKSFQTEKRMSNKKKQTLDESNIKTTPKLSSNYESIPKDSKEITSYIEPIQMTTLQNNTKKQKDTLTVSSSKITPKSYNKKNNNSNDENKTCLKSNERDSSEIEQKMYDSTTNTSITIPVQTQQQKKLSPFEPSKETNKVEKQIPKDNCYSKITLTKSASLSNLPKQPNSSFLVQLAHKQLKENVVKPTIKPSNEPPSNPISKENGFFKLIKDYITNKADSLKKSFIESTTSISNIYQPKHNKKNVKKSTIQFRTTSSTITI